MVVPLADISRGTNLQLNFGDAAYFPIPAIGTHTKFTIKGLELGGKVGLAYHYAIIITLPGLPVSLYGNRSNLLFPPYTDYKKQIPF